MLIRTHLVITLFLVLLLIGYVNHSFLFLVVALLATYIPDIDTKNSKIGHHILFRPIQWLSRHRGMMHSFSFLILITLFISLFFPIVALGFFVGYASHLFADSFTIEGIRPFYPSKKRSSGNVITGSVSETNIFVIFLVIDIILFIMKSSIMF
jgi:inner membrane protein